MPTESEYERFVKKLKKTKTRKLNKPKVIKKDLLMQVRLAYIKYHNVLNNDFVEEECYKEWKNACKKAFPHDKRNYREYDLLKEMLRTLRYKDNDTVVRVYQALGYIVE